MRTMIDEYKGQKIWIDENGQFWTGEADSKRFWNPGTSIKAIKDDIDFLEAYEKATPIKVIRLEYPYLQTWNIRKVTTVEFGRSRTRWFTKDNPNSSPDQEKYPREFPIYCHVIEYDEAVYLECERRFGEIRAHYDRFDMLKAEMKLETD